MSSYKISTVEIKSLWGKFDVFWRLNPDVNILSGINGSGKSTIIDCIAELCYRRSFENPLWELVKDIKITCENGEIISRENKLSELIKIDLIRTFDRTREPIEVSDDAICTELDRTIANLQQRYLAYQLVVSKKVTNILRNDNSATAHESVAQLMQQQQKFLAMVDALFAETGKTINKDKNEIAFLCGKDQLTPYQLSSGEKQMLIILLVALLQDNQTAILLMDEPEISLHFDWQKKLIQYIRELNPNVQIILATHSPAVIMEGWLDKVAEVRDLIQNASTECQQR